MKILPRISAITLILLLFSNIFAKQTLAVLPFYSSNIDIKETGDATEKLRSELSKKQLYTVMNGKEMETLLSEQGFDPSAPCNELSCAVTLGQLLAVDNIVIGNIGKVGTTYMINIKIINVNSGSIYKDIAENHPVKINIILNKIVPLLAEKLTNSQYVDETVIKKKRRPYIAIIAITAGTAVLAIPAYFIYKKVTEPKQLDTRDIMVQW
jgi:hypothetical protein